MSKQINVKVDARTTCRIVRKMLDAMRDLLNEVAGDCGRPEPHLGMSITLGDDQENHIMDPIQVSATDGKRFTLTIAPKNARGRPAQVDGAPEWTSSDESVCEIAPSDDGMSCRVRCLASGTATITCDADADLGAGVVSLSQQCVVTVSPSNATDLGMAAGDLEDDE